jgi:hypothetical protein
MQQRLHMPKIAMPKGKYAISYGIWFKLAKPLLTPEFILPFGQEKWAKA